MSELIKSQLMIMIVMIYCGLASGLINEFFTLIRLRFIKWKWLSGTVQVIGYLFIGFLFGKFLYYCNWGKLSFEAAVCFLIGLWLWRKFLYGIIANDK